MRILLENGPFGGCSMEAEDCRKVPSNLWIDRQGRVTDSAVVGDGNASIWVGKVAEPRPVVEWSIHYPEAGEFGYDRTDATEPGFDGVLKFSGTLALEDRGDI